MASHKDKTLKLVEDSDLTAPVEDNNTPIDWNKCLFCEKDTNEKLQCPAEFTDRFRGVGYATIAENLKSFNDLGCLPVNIKLACMDDGDGVQQTLLRMKAKFHKSCRLKFNKNELQRASKRKRLLDDDNTSSGMNVHCKRQKKSEILTQVAKCFLCDKPASTARPLHEVQTFDLDARVRQCATDLQDDRLLMKLSEGDLIATEAKYHSQCLVSLYNRQRDRRETSEDECTTNNAHSTAFAELIQFMQCSLVEEGISPVFKLSVLKNMYSKRVAELGGHSSEVHSTRFKNRILIYFPGIQAYNEGREVLLVLNKDVGKSIKTSCELENDNEAVLISRVANIIRRDIYKSKYFPFNNSFTQHCQENSVPHSLCMLLAMIMNGTNIKEQSTYLSQTVLSLSQLIKFNSSTNRHQEGTSVTRHVIERETPLPLFVGALLHSRTRSRDLVETFHRLGLSVTYDRVLGMSADLGNSAINHFENIGTVCPPKLNKGVFTTSAVDNIDHNPTATTASHSFHGTGISLFQHPDADNTGTKQVCTAITKSGKKVNKLPEEYTLVPAVTVVNKHPSIPKVCNLAQSDCSQLDEEVAKEYKWCDHVASFVDEKNTNKLTNDLQVSWAVYHAKNSHSGKNNEHSPVTVSALLPLFPDDSKSVAMIRHSMDVVKKAVQVLNPGQTPVIACDQPLFMIAKQIQWMWPEQYGEGSFVVMLGGLHIKMTLLKVLGDLLDGSGWTSALVEANIATPGTADSFLKAAHIKRTALAHQVTACALYKLRQEAYENYLMSPQEGPASSFEDWCSIRAVQSPQFHFWQLVLKIQFDILTWDRSVHDGNFTLYIDSLTHLQWLFHTLDHHNYARAVAIHLRDLVALREKLPDIYAAFCDGKFTIRKSCRPFSRMALDEGHEQNNACVKGDGGAVGLTENPAALLRWMVAGPEMARVVGEFLSLLDKKEADCHLYHHEDKPATQLMFLNNTKSLIKTVKSMGNPFSDTSGDLIVLDTREVVDTAVVESMRKLEKLGEDKCNEFFESRLVKCTIGVGERLPKNNVQLFRSRKRKDKSLTQKQLLSMKHDRNLFSTLYIASQVRDTDLQDFFKHENHSFPPSLSNYGQLRLGTKSDLLQCLENMVPESDNTESIQPDTDMVIMDGAVIVNMIKPVAAETFNDYASEFMKYVRKQFRAGVKRVDVVFDNYRPDSLKSATRMKRGKGTRLRVEGKNKLPGNWHKFLREDGNKTELFNLLSERVTGEQFHGLVVMTLGDSVCSSEPFDEEHLSPCTHEEADTRMLLHAADGVTQGMKRITIRTVDTDVVVLAISHASKIQCEQLNIAFGTGKSFRYIDATLIAQTLGDQKCKALPAFHALTGCDTTSSFAGRGKHTAWITWNMLPDITPSLCTLAHTPTIDNIRELLPTFERFVVLLYDRGSSDDNVNSARQTLFTQKHREIENIPPTQDSLYQHLLRAGYQAGHVWSQVLYKEPHLPSPADFGWIKKDTLNMWEIKWMDLPPAGVACRAVIKCGCTAGCRGKCKCVKENLPCTSLCKCSHKCNR